MPCVSESAAEMILQRLPTVTQPEVQMLHAMWQGGDAAIRARAWQHGKDALADHGAAQRYEEANSAVGRWVRDYATGRIGMYSNVLDASFHDQDRMEMRMQAAPAVLDAILGSLIGEALPTDEVETLLGPWNAVFGADEGSEPTDTTDVATT